jgi:DNA-binding SARP family transcriptional activator
MQIEVTSIELGLLDGLELTANGHAMDLPLGAQRLLAFLALSDRPLRRTYIAGVLWSETTEERAAASLRSTLWRLRCRAPHVVQADATRLRLAPAVRVDYREMVRRLNDLSAEGGDVDVDVGQLPLTAELLPDWYDDWVYFEREQYRQFRLHALEAISEKLLARRRHAEAIQFSLAAIAAEPLRDSAYRLLIRAHLSEGNRSEAIREFRDYCNLLRRELGVDPAPEVQALIASSATPVVRP